MNAKILQFWTFAVVAFLAGLVPSRVLAQACCSATSAGEAGVVGRCHSAMVATSLGLEHGIGFTDSSGSFESFDSTASTDATFMLAAGLRPFDRRFRVGAVVPARFQYRSAPGLSSSSLRIADVSWSTGFLVLEDPMIGLDSALPFLEPFLAGTVATGVGPGDSDDPLSADTTSQGGHSIGAGVRVIKFVTSSNAVRLSGEYRHFLSHEIESVRGTTDLRTGPFWEFGAGWTYEGSIFWSAGVFGQLRLQGELEENGVAVDGSDARRLFTGISFRRSIAFPWWDLTASAGQDLLFGKNLARSGVAVTVGVRRNFL